MNKGGILAILAVIAYLGFELHTINQARYRMEKPYIFNQFVSANRAFVVCRKPEGEQYEKFQRNFELMRERTLQELGKLHPDASEEAVREMISERINDNEQIADALIDTRGCSDTEVWKLLRRFEIFARKNLGASVDANSVRRK